MKKKILLIGTLIVLIALIGVMVSLIYAEINKNYFSSTIKSEAGEIIYRSSTTATEYQKEIFKQLDLNLKEGVDAKLIAADIVSNYVADFYTWSNKKGTYDVGGMQYIYQPEIINTYIYAKESYYKDLSHYVDVYGQASLPEVESVTITFSDYNVPVEYNGETYVSFYVTATWTYVAKEGFDTSNLQTSGEFSLVERNNQIEIYRYY